ncbi:MAPEG family protein [Oceanomicrobium pacificus]|uniref:MAPEG family protein n=1 Tax=Oceanomicrobium pacificus TaxID=2692916 RepID=A0A6B0U5U4_9RHOB|nr:MAPEG family protein [Oceanomicrobium pacificus]MXU66271.1 hypothetical protein [Oceanomicrobium pacificus]
MSDLTLTAGLALGAVFFQVALTFWAIIAMGQGRLAALQAKQVRMADIAIETDAYPENVRLLQANVRNQFETPVLLYAGVGIALATGAVNWGVALGALTYAVSRALHRWVHAGSNHLPSRFNAFVLGLVGLLILWLALAAGLIFAA